VEHLASGEEADHPGGVALEVSCADAYCYDIVLCFHIVLP